MPLHDIRQLIGTSAELELVRAKAQKQVALQQAFVGYTQTELAYLSKASRVGYIKAGTLYLLADHAAAAAKLRQLLPRLLPLFHKLDGEITGIKVEVQVKTHHAESGFKRQKNSLPIDSIEYFKNLARSVKNKELKLAITNLVRKRTK